MCISSSLARGGAAWGIFFSGNVLIQPWLRVKMSDPKSLGDLKTHKVFINFPE
jgi:hypothetical protein